MTTQILATKLYAPPPRPEIVVRSRLHERLNTGLNRRLTLICAPAGFGKTTLVSNWVSGGQRPTAWLSLDEGDNDLSRFLTYLIAALQTLAPTIGEGTLGTLQSPQPLQLESLLTTLINEINDSPDSLVLVVDDYHVIETEPCNSAVAFLLEHLPPHMHLILITREDPQLPLARLRVRGQLTELRAVDLRFTPSEAAEFMNSGMGLNLSATDIAALEARTEGWIAGLQLAAISMQGHEDTSTFIETFTGSHRFVLDYLVEEVLQQQPDRIQNFLLCTSILDRLCGSLCDAMLLDASVSGQETLEHLEHANLFLVPLDNERRWYRYHHLFAELLRNRLTQGTGSTVEGHTPAGAAHFHLRASAWYADNGWHADAIHHALAANDFTWAAGLVERAWPTMDGRFQAAAWMHWAKALPDDIVRTRPVLCLAYAWGLLNNGELEAAESYLANAERWLEVAAARGERPETTLEWTVTDTTSEMVVTDEAQFRTLPASLATARAYQALARGDVAGSVPFGRRALNLLPETDYHRRGPAAALLALAQWASGDLDAGYQTLADAMINFQKVGSLHFAISGTYGLADIRITQGRLRDAIKIYTVTLTLALEQGEPPLRGTANLYLGLSEIFNEQGATDAAIENMRHCEALGEQAALPNSRHRLYRAKARFRETTGDLAGALELLEEAERHYHRTPVPDLRPLAALKARVWIAQGRLSEALRWVHEQGLSADDRLSFLREVDHITLARVLIAQYAANPDNVTIGKATELLDRLLEAAEDGQRIGSVIEIAVLQALAHQAQGNTAAALSALERALWLAEPEGYVRIFVNEGPSMAQLLAQAAAHGVMPDYVGQLLAAFRNEMRPSEPKVHVSSSRSLLDSLSQRELEILQLIAQGLSNHEISQRLFLALSTVKGHNRNIFDKLRVQSRTEAVACALELNLL